MKNLILKQLFRHSYTREFGYNHVMPNGDERYCVVYKFIDISDMHKIIPIEIDYESSTNRWYATSTRIYFDNFIEPKSFSSKKDTIAYSLKCYTNYLNTKITI